MIIVCGKKNIIPILLSWMVSRIVYKDYVCRLSARVSNTLLRVYGVNSLSDLITICNVLCCLGTPGGRLGDIIIKKDDTAWRPRIIVIRLWISNAWIFIIILLYFIVFTMYTLLFCIGYSTDECFVILLKAL